MEELIREITEGLLGVREKKPLIHHLTNHVVMSGCADVTLHAGGSPVMTLAAEEAEDMASLADGLVLNIGTLTSPYVDIMIAAGKAANRKGIPVLLDPVGAGATSMRTDAAGLIMREVKVAIVKGNLGEMSVLSGIEAEVRGVDSAGSSGKPSAVARKFSRKSGCAAVVTGPEDYVCGGGSVFCIKNGHVMLSRLVGTGCMLGSVIACFAAVMKDSAAAACAGVVSFGIAAQLAAEKSGGGPASFKSLFFDEIFSLDSGQIFHYADIELADEEIKVAF